jgi:hypothetical protein
MIFVSQLLESISLDERLLVLAIGATMIFIAGTMRSAAGHASIEPQSGEETAVTGENR